MEWALSAVKSGSEARRRHAFFVIIEQGVVDGFFRGDGGGVLTLQADNFSSQGAKGRSRCLRARLPRHLRRGSKSLHTSTTREVGTLVALSKFRRVTRSIACSLESSPESPASASAARKQIPGFRRPQTFHASISRLLKVGGHARASGFSGAYRSADPTQHRPRRVICHRPPPAAPLKAPSSSDPCITPFMNRRELYPLGPSPSPPFPLSPCPRLTPLLTPLLTPHRRTVRLTSSVEWNSG